MAVAAGLDLAMLGDAGFLAEARQGVIFAKEGNDRAAFAGLADHRGRDIGDVLGNPEALVLELGDMLGDRALLGVADLGNGPDAVAEFDEALFAGVDVTPEVVAIVHVLISLERGASPPFRKRGHRRPATAGHGGPARRRRIVVSPHPEEPRRGVSKDAPAGS